MFASWMARLRPQRPLMLMSNLQPVLPHRGRCLSPWHGAMREPECRRGWLCGHGPQDAARLPRGRYLHLRVEPGREPLAGYRPAKPMVFAGLYPAEGEDYALLRDALAKLQLNDASLIYEPETSQALGFGFRCGFLGLFHMDIIQERLEREYDLDIVFTSPSVEYQVLKTDGELLEIDNPAKLPPENEIEQIEEPWMQIQIFTPAESLAR